MRKDPVGPGRFAVGVGSLIGSFVEAEYLRTEAEKLAAGVEKLAAGIGKLAAEIEWLAVEVGLLVVEAGSLIAEVEVETWVLVAEWFVVEVENFASGASEVGVERMEHYCWLRPMENPKHCFPRIAHQVQQGWGPNTTWSSVVCQLPGAG